MAGLAWLGKRTVDRSVTLIIGNAQASIALGRGVGSGRSSHHLRMSSVRSTATGTHRNVLRSSPGSHWINETGHVTKAAKLLVSTWRV